MMLHTFLIILAEASTKKGRCGQTALAGTLYCSDPIPNLTGTRTKNQVICDKITIGKGMLLLQRARGVKTAVPVPRPHYDEIRMVAGRLRAVSSRITRRFI